MDCEIRDEGGVAIVALTGDVDLETSPRVRGALLDCVGAKRSVLVDMSGVSYIDSSGLGELVSSYTTAANQGGKVKLLNLQKKVQDLLQITKLYTVFDTFENEADAVLSFS